MKFGEENKLGSSSLCRSNPRITHSFTHSINQSINQN